jgi:hypothetical protein
MSGLDNLRRRLRRAMGAAEDEAAGGTVVARPPAGAESTESGDADRETSTNAQMQGAADEPWPGNG